MTLRRIPAAACSLAFMAVVVAACATPDVQCGMRADYERDDSAWSADVRVTWRVDATRLKPNEYGNTQCFETRDGRVCVIFLREAPSFNSVCSLAKLGHEVIHAAANHE